MARKNLLTLHEAIVIALIQNNIRRATFDEIAAFIEKRNLYPVRKGNIPLARQVMIRSTKSKGAYSDLFTYIGMNCIELRDTDRHFGLQLYNALEVIYKDVSSHFAPPPKALKVVDIELRMNREIELSASNVVCIISKHPDGRSSGQKKYLYVLEHQNEEQAIRLYTTNDSFKTLQKTLDPLNEHLVIVNDSSIANVRYYQYTATKTLSPVNGLPVNIKPQEIHFSGSPKSKTNKGIFDLVQNHFNNRILLEKKLLDSIISNKDK